MTSSRHGCEESSRVQTFFAVRNELFIDFWNISDNHVYLCGILVHDPVAEVLRDTVRRYATSPCAKTAQAI